MMGRGKNHRGGVLYLTQRAPLDLNGKLLGDVRFTRDRLKRWHAVVQRIDCRGEAKALAPDYGEQERVSRPGNSLWKSSIGQPPPANHTNLQGHGLRPCGTPGRWVGVYWNHKECPVAIK